MSVATCAALAAPVTAQSETRSSRSKLSPPVIREQFTPLRCPRHPQSTIELEGCAEQRIIRTDRQIDATVKTLFGLLPDDGARAHLTSAQRAWLAFRKADCLSVSDKYERGTLAGVLDANCTGDRSAQRLKELRAFERLLRNP
jgi:uncharacterized protein YecT (DUF1311 family)